ncbi:Hpt domain-containing protein [Kineococcus sp. SYSU DK005]|uniref:Hpt domain-containing protein n=1 Tax=Kineococcus sp. SYSU DK005 TaxID=3383126 RepID=UPI003D7E9DB2
MNEVDAMRALTADLWEQLRPLVRARLSQLDEWVARGQGLAGRAEAVRTAHNLSGSLGSYGRHDGSRVARELERALLEDASPALVVDLVAALHRAVDA